MLQMEQAESELTQITVLGQLPTNSGWTLISYKELRVIVTD